MPPCGESLAAGFEPLKLTHYQWSLGPTDVPIRLWTLTDLRLLARAAGYHPPEIHQDEHLILFHPHDRFPGA